MRCGGQLTFDPFAARSSGFDSAILDGSIRSWLSPDGVDEDTGAETTTPDSRIYDDAGRDSAPSITAEMINIQRRYFAGYGTDGMSGGQVGSPSSLSPPGGASNGSSNGPPNLKDPKKYLERTSTPKGELDLLREAQNGTEDGKEWMVMVRLGRSNFKDFEELAQRPLVKALEAMTNTVLVPRHDNFAPEERTPWGGTRIMDEMKSELGLDAKPRIVGESWEISGHHKFPNTFPLDYAGEEIDVSILTLNVIFPGELYGEHAMDLHGEGMPFLVKLVNSGSWGRYTEKLKETLGALDEMPNAMKWNRTVNVDKSLTEILGGNHHTVHRALSRYKALATKDALRRCNSMAKSAEWRRSLGVNNLAEILNMNPKEFVAALKRLSLMLSSDGYREMAGELKHLHQLHDLHQRMLSKNLSVQVHPPADYDRLGDNEHSKTEAWTIIEAEPGAGIYLGLQEGVTADQFRAALKKGDDVTNYLNFVEVKAGDVFFIPAGTIHAIGAGVLLVEPQETSETTYRVYDYGRLDARGNPRQLHVDNAIAVTKWDGPRGEKAVAAYRRVPELIPSGRERAAKVERLLRESAFESSRITFSTGDEYLGSGKPGVKGFTVISGEIEVMAGESEEPAAKFIKGQSFIIPAALGNYVIRGIAPDSTVVKTSVSLPLGIGDTKPTSSITNVIKSQRPELQARNEAFVALNAPHFLIINPQGYMGPEVPMGSVDSGGQLTYVAEMARQLAKRSYKVSIAVRSFKPEKEYELYGDRRGVAFMEGVEDRVRFIYVPGVQAEGAAFMRKEDIYSELPSMARNLDLFLQDESEPCGLNPWKYVQVINSHYVDGGVVGQLLQRRWGHSIVGDHLLEHFRAILPPKDDAGSLDSTNIMGHLEYNFGTCVVRAWRMAHGIDDSPAMAGLPVDVGEVMRWAGSKIGWTPSHTEQVIASLNEVEPAGLEIGREEASFKIGYRLLHEAGAMDVLERKLNSISEMHVWTPHSLGKLKEYRMVQAGRHKTNPRDFLRMSFHTRET
ncbi:MAG: hypothetical protein WC956_08575, partial [bacterium]